MMNYHTAFRKVRGLLLIGLLCQITQENETFLRTLFYELVDRVARPGGVDIRHVSTC